MGPRAVARGILDSAFIESLTLTLQWGRELLLAESLLRLVDQVSLVELQWGRELLLAESSVGEVYLATWLRASMGPRAVARGIILQIDNKEHLFWASMGPRAVARGICQRRVPGTPIRSLQWGRELLLAESAWSLAIFWSLTALQWGRELLLAESR